MLDELAEDLLPTTNMMLEGFLSEVKSAVPKSKPKGGSNAEKVAWLSHLSQLLREHMAAGRRDCRASIDRTTLLQEGVPLEHDFVSSRRPGVRWRNFHLARWRQNLYGDGPSDPSAESAEMRRLAAQWLAFSKEEQASAISMLDSERIDSKPKRPRRRSEPNPPRRQHTPPYFDCGDQNWPVVPDVLQNFVHTHEAHRSHGFAGIARKATAIREAARGSLVISGPPDDQVYSHRHSCPQVHPGVCCTRDADVYEDVLKFAVNLERALDDRFLHRFFAVVDGENLQDHLVSGRPPLF